MVHPSHVYVRVFALGVSYAVFVRSDSLELTVVVGALTIPFPTATVGRLLAGQAVREALKSAECWS